MKASILRRNMVGLLTLGIAALGAIGIHSSALAGPVTYMATLDNNVTNIYGDIYPNTSPHYEAITFATGSGSVFSVDQNVDFNGSALSNVFASTEFISTGGRVEASMVGTDEFFSPVSGREFIVKNFVLDNVDFTTSNGNTGDVALKIQGLDGGNTSLSLANSTLSCAITPRLYSPSAFSFNVSGTSQIDGWGGRLSSTTTISVASGGSLRIKNCGDLSSGAPVSAKLYFAQDSNNAIINGSSLIIDNSALVFGCDPFGDVAKESTMTFSNNATLLITGLNPTSSLVTDNLVFQNSTLNVATNNSRLTLRNTLELDNSSATIATSAHADTVKVVAKGTSTVSLGVYGRLNTATLDIKAGAIMTVAGNSSDIGEMTVGQQVLFPSSGTGTLVVGNLKAVLNLASGATMDLTSHASLTNNGTINQQESLVTVRQGSTVKNNVEWTVQAASTLAIDGNATIGQDSGQHGHLAMGGTLAFSGSGNNTLNTTNELNLESTAILKMTIDPTNVNSDRIIIDNGAREFTIDNSVALSLSLINDTVLAPGTRFLLIDYPDWQVAMGAHFTGLVDGSIFALGLNTYKINYNDANYRPIDGSTFITLTTVAVPEPGTIVLLGLGFLAIGRRPLRRRG